MQGSGGCRCAAPRIYVRPRSAEPAIQWVSHPIHTHCSAEDIHLLLHMRFLSEKRPGATITGVERHCDMMKDWKHPSVRSRGIFASDLHASIASLLSLHRLLT